MHGAGKPGRPRSLGDHVLLNAIKSMVTSAGEADSYVWSSQPVEAEGASTIWIVETKRDGLKSPNPFDGLGLRANASAPVSATDVRVPLAHRLAEAALLVTDTAMRVCGGAAFRKDVGIERLFRDSRAAAVMAPTTDVINDLIAAARDRGPARGAAPHRRAERGSV